MKNSCLTCFQNPVSLRFHLQPPCYNFKFKMAELHMYQEDFVSKDISSFVLVIAKYT